MNKVAKSISTLGLAAALSGGVMAGEVEDKFMQMIESGDAYSAETLMPLFEQLEPRNCFWMTSLPISRT